MRLTVNEIAQLIKGKVNGEGNAVITSAAGLGEATSSDISFLKNSSDAPAMKLFSFTKAGAVIVAKGFSGNGKTTIEVENPLVAFATVLSRIEEEKKPQKPGIHPMTSVAPTAKIGKNVTIGPFCVIEEGAEIGDGAWLVGQVYVGARSKVGNGTLLYPQVVLREDVSVGQRCILHAGAVIGSDGYGFFFANGKHNKIPQVGTVILEDDVEVGSCTTIDRATTGATIIKRGTKIDNLVQIAHNVEVGEHNLLAAQVGIAGSSKVGAGSVLAGQVGVADHVSIGKQNQIGAQAGIGKDTPDGAVLWGTPADPLQEAIRYTLLIRRLPEIFKDVRKLKENSHPHE